MFEPFLPSFSEFEELTGMKVNFDAMPYPGLTDKLALEMTTGSDAYDWIMSGTQLWSFSLLPFMEPLDDLIAAHPPEEFDKVNKGFLDMHKAEGHQYGWAIRTGVYIMTYRKDLYEEKGLSVPKTFAELRENARALNDPPNTYGWYCMGTPDSFSQSDWINYLFSFGGKLVSDDGKKCLLDSAEALAATKFWSEWMTEGLVPPGTAEHKYSDLITAMQQGLAAQCFHYSPYVIPFNDPEQSKFPGKFGHCVVPVWEKSGLDHSISFNTGMGCWMPKASKHKEAAWEWMRWVTNPENDLAMALGGNGPTRDTTFDHPSFVEKNAAAPVIKEAMDYGRMTCPPVEARREISDIVAVQLSALAAGQQGPEEALQAMIDQITALL